MHQGRKQDVPLTREELRIERTQRFGVIVRVLRENKGISKEVLAEKAQLPFSFVEDLEAMTLVMEDLSLGVLTRIADALGENPKSLATRAQFSVEDLPIRSQRSDVETMRRVAEASEKVIKAQDSEPSAT